MQTEPALTILSLALFPLQAGGTPWRPCSPRGPGGPGFAEKSANSAFSFLTCFFSFLSCFLTLLTCFLTLEAGAAGGAASRQPSAKAHTRTLMARESMHGPA